MALKSLYRIHFAFQDVCYEIYARSIYESDLFGFLEVEQIVFGENSSLLVDPTEEKLKTEFKSVKKTYIPMHNVFRIDEVEQEGTAKIHEKNAQGKVSWLANRNQQKD
jgi:hypothetical protein